MFDQLRKFFGLNRSSAVSEPKRDATNLVLDAVKSQSQACVRLTRGIGRSKLGGRPHLPADQIWPLREGRPLEFLAEIDLAEIRSAGGPSWLPGEGVLLFFYDAENQPWGFDPADDSGWAVIHAPAADLNAATPPDDHAAFPEKKLTPKLATSYPSAERLGPQLFLSDYDFDAVDSLQRRDFEDGPNHQIGGFPQSIQGDAMELEAQLASNGIYLGDGKGYSGRRAKMLEPGARDWRLLLQIDTDDDTEMMWGDVGTIYFWIRKQDALAGNFAKAWLVLQCS